MGFFLTRTKKQPKLSHRLKESGNVFMMLFGAVGMVGVIGASTMTVMKGPVKTMANVTKRTVAENNMIATGKLALMGATSQSGGGDCDSDGTVEPLPYGGAVAGYSGGDGGGQIPAAISAAKQDSWGTDYVYCAWDHGSGDCGSSNLLTGTTSQAEYVLAVISAGPDRTFNTTCHDYVNPTTKLLNKTPGSDDLVHGYTYSEATAMSGGVWDLTPDDTTAEISKNLSVKDSGGTEQLAFDAASKSLSLTDASASGQFPTVKTDFIQQIGSAGVEFLSNIKLGSSWLSGDGGNEGLQIAADGNVTASGDVAATGNMSAVDLAASGNLAVTGTSTLAAVSATTLGTSDLAILESLDVTNDSDLGGTLDVTGATTLTALTATGTSDLKAIDAEGQITLTNTITANPDILMTNGGIIAADDSLRLTIDADNDSAANTFTILKDTMVDGAGSELFRVDEAGLITVQGKITNLTTPADPTDATTKAYVDGAVAAGTGYTETDPQVATLTASKWCRSNVGGTAIECTEDTPSGAGDDLGDHTATQALDMTTKKIINLADPTVSQDAATKAYVDTAVVAGSDDLGNHTATQHIKLGVNYLSNDGDAAEGVAVATNGSVTVTAGNDMTTTFPLNVDGALDAGGISYNYLRLHNTGAQAEAISGLYATDGTSLGYLTYNHTDKDWKFYNDGGTPGDVTLTIEDDGDIIAAGQIKNVTDPTLAQDVATKAYVDANAGGSADDLGNHTATQDLDMATNDITNAGDISGVDLIASGAIHADGSYLYVPDASVGLHITNGSGIGRAIKMAGIHIGGSYAGSNPATGEIITSGTTDIVLKSGGTTAMTLDAVTQNITVASGLSMSTNKITNLADPTVSTDAATKSYVDTAVIAGADDLGSHNATQVLNMATNKITNVVDPTADQDAATKKYVDDNESDVVASLSCSSGQIAKWNGTAWACASDIGGGAGDDLGNHTATTAIIMATNKITGLGDPTAAQDAATKAYVDTEVAGVTESDPQVDTLTAGKWCTSNGTVISCTTDAPVGDDLGNHTATTAVIMATNKITGLGDPTADQDAATKKYVDDEITAAGGADDLGNHTATQDLDMATNDIINPANISLGGSDIDGALTITDTSDIGGINNVGEGSIVIQDNAANAVGSKLRIDANEMQASLNGVATGLYLNLYGGDVSIGSVNASNLIMHGNRIRSVSDPVTPQDAATKAYVDSIASGDTLAGLSCSSGQIAKWNGSAWACAADGGSAGGDDLGNHTATQALAMATNKITGLGDPTLAQDAATKKYVDDEITAAGGADDLGNHNATQNIQLGANYLSNDGDNEGISIAANGATTLRSTNTSTHVLNVTGSFDSVGTSYNYLNLNNTGSGATKASGLVVGDGASTGYMVYNHGSKWWSLYNDGGTSAEVSMRVNEGGDTSIGSTVVSADLKLDVEGKIGATHYCDENGANCIAATALSGSDNLGNHTATQNIQLGTNKLVGNGGTSGVYIDSTGNVALSGTDTDGVITITGAPDISGVNNEGEGAIVLQNNAALTTGNKMRIDSNEIQSITNNVGTTLLLNPYGGNVAIGSNTPGSVLSMYTNKIIGLGDPTAAQDAATKAYVDANGADDLGDHTATQDIDAANNKVINLATPTAGTDATTKTYVDTAVAASGDNLGGGGTTTGTLYSKDGTNKGYVGLDTTDHFRFDDELRALLKVKNRWEYEFSETRFTPYYDDENDLGSTSKKWKNAYFSGNVTAIDPTADAHLATKKYVDDEIVASGGSDTLAALSCSAGQIPKWNGSAWACAADVGGTGGDNLGDHTATQALAMATNKITGMGDPTAAQDAATKAYVDAEVASGGADDLGNHTATTDLDLGSNKVVNLATPTAAADATTKAYVDTAVAASGDNLGGGGTTTGRLYSKNATGYGYFGTSGSNFLRFDETPAASNGRAYMRLDGTYEYQFRTTYFAPYATNANDLGATGLRWKDGYFAGNVFGTAAPTLGEHLANKTYVDAQIASGGADNLGNHTATTDLDLGTNKLLNIGGSDASLSNGSGYMVLGLESGTNIVFDNNEIVARNNGSAASLYLNQEGGNVNIGKNNDPVVAHLDMNEGKIIDLTDPTAAQDAATKAYVDTTIAAGGDNLGNHTATTTLSMANNDITGTTKVTFTGVAGNAPTK